VKDFIKEKLTMINYSLWNVTSISITDIIDILIVAFILYKVILWGKETRTWSLFKGLAVIALISFISSIFNFHTLKSIIEYVFNVGIIAIVILFQPELRKGLEQIGKGKLFTSLTGIDKTVQNAPEIALTQIVSACRSMAKEKTGALIVIEQGVPLGDHEKTGILIDGLISSQLLINIFENKTPLHDGAVIIRNNRIAAASCILPLTQTQIGQKFGTRHRAGVGSSEVSDAKVLIVSEETGHVSMAIAGKIYKNLSDEKIMEKLLNDKDTSRRKASMRKADIDVKKNQ
jgi:diadenylate cyclase